MAEPGQYRVLSRPLCRGVQGPEVKTLQLFLNNSGANPRLGADGRFGPRTHRALKAFQKASGLKPDGVVGAKTASVLGWSYSGQHAVPYIIRYDRPPLPASTPPMLVLRETIHDGFRRYFAKLEDAVRQCGLSERAINLLISNDLRSVILPGLLESLDMHLDEEKSEIAAVNGITTAQMQTTILRYFGLIGFMGQNIRQAGGSTAALAKVYDAGDRLSEIGKIAGSLLEGEVSPTMAMTRIQIAFDVAIGSS